MSAREYTKDESLKMFLHCVERIASYWAKPSHKLSDSERCQAVARGILALIDGVDAMPAIDLSITQSP